MEDVLCPCWCVLFFDTPSKWLLIGLQSTRRQLESFRYSRESKAGKSAHQYVRGGSAKAGTWYWRIYQRSQYSLSLRDTLATRPYHFSQQAPFTYWPIFQADLNEPNFQQTFWGSNYPRLLKIKNKYDPTDVFWCQPCVGNEGWEVVDDVLCRK